MKQSLGLLEVSGLALAISCADVMAKAASITLVGLEKTNGSGWTVIKIIGDVASVQAAISTGANLAELRNGLVAHRVISRPGEGILSHSVPVQPEPAPAPEPIPYLSQEQEEMATEIALPEAAQQAELISCNLCLDPACPRQKGEPRTLCLHSGKRGEA
ncbi:MULTISPECIES: BMC domain-containing protein [Citrobacter]|uniref:Propanediol utilization protein PduK n=2 Tax=Gammaproteobacteria TaxID=1236 RepID=A0A9Q7ZSL9_9ENTR|nr:MULTISPECIES: BMC domain-containing protein [Citrobacter]AMH14174.1 BMC domain-containing protein [Citrobacter sp. FDAARGOS_156]MBJ8739232.1 BMC domain-containing protein [Citrobacter sp. FDAARGOS_156]MBJ8925495.1 BMC domain-containing protein [Citrobacter sp. FDAARGOS_156]MBJ8957569.1 BMC domain-containing protein [Citrobacter youngae]MBJ9110648.1 BMC domain-containing protein [Citrobacter sp. FDAARGOS_156]